MNHWITVSETPPKNNLSNLPDQTLKKKKTMGSSEDPSFVNNFDEIGLVY
jgi:hypothetical protein